MPIQVRYAVLVTMLLSTHFLFAPRVRAEQGEDPEGKVPDKLTEKDIRELARSAFVFKDKNGKEWTLVRLTESQTLRTKATEKLKKPSIVILTPRQRLAIKHALKIDAPMPGKIALKISPKRIYSVTSLKGRYIARPSDAMKKFVTGPKDVEEADEPVEQPLPASIEEIKPLP